MRVLFSGRPAYGHLYPLMPLALALRDGGAEVIFGTGREFRDRVAALGFETYQVGRSILWAEEEAIRQDPSLAELPQQDKGKLGATMFSRLLPPPTVEDLLAVIEKTSPSLVVYEGADFGAAIAARVAGIPSVFHSYGAPWPAFMVELLRPGLQEVARSHGLGTDEVDPLAGDVYLDISPAALGDASALGHPRRQPLRPVAFSEPIGDVPAWALEQRDRPVAYVTLGTVVFERVEVIRAVARGLAALDVDVLVTVGPDGDLELLGDLPANVHAERFVRQDRLLEHVDVIVSHCGSGTLLGGLAHGIPQVAVPQGADQFLNADALVRAGAGLALMPSEITPETISERAERLLTTPPFKAAAEDVAAQIASMPAPADVARALRGLL
ncbi:MAG TPA: glycosyltransferase [Solirubrobacteraceae bacterium]|nr:glycosyltransferase [Solirubrobacteraceae bacterium]